MHKAPIFHPGRTRDSPDDFFPTFDRTFFPGSNPSPFRLPRAPTTTPAHMAVPCSGTRMLPCPGKIAMHLIFKAHDDMIILSACGRPQTKAQTTPDNPKPFQTTPDHFKTCRSVSRNVQDTPDHPKPPERSRKHFNTFRNEPRTHRQWFGVVWGGLSWSGVVWLV